MCLYSTRNLKKEKKKTVFLKTGETLKPLKRRAQINPSSG